METISDDPTVGQVLELMGADAPAEAPPTKDSAPEAQRAGQEVVTEVPPSSEPKADAPATAESVKPAEKTEPKPDVPRGTEADKGSNFAKNQQRLQGSWKQLNEQKDAFRKEQESLKAEKEELTRKAQEFEVQRQKASQPQYTPEQLEGYAVRQEKEAETLEAAGKYDEADKKRYKAEEFRQWAAQVRANPPAPSQTEAQLKAQFVEQQKQWWSKAAIDFPQVAKEGTPEAKALKALIESNPQTFEKYPDAMYWSARLVCAETTAARVSAQEKELGELRAKVKDLNEQLAIPIDTVGGQPAGEKEFKDKSPEEQEAELRKMAAALESS